jgi:hypothetical protein
MDKDTTTSRRRPSLANRIASAILLAFFVYLASSLWVVYSRVAEAQSVSNCSNNLHELAIVLQIYWTDYDATLPSSALVKNSRMWNAQDFARYATERGALPARGKAETWLQVLHSHVRSSDSEFCPSDPASRRDPKSRVSYYWRTAIDQAWFGLGCSRPVRREYDFAYNSDQIVLYEHRDFHNPVRTLWFWRSFPSLKNGVRINVVYLDTHVRNLVLTNATTGNPDKPELCTNGEPMYFNYDMGKKKGPTNPPPAKVPARYTDPSRYADMLP